MDEGADLALLVSLKRRAHIKNNGERRVDTAALALEALDDGADPLEC